MKRGREKERKREQRSMHLKQKLLWFIKFARAHNCFSSIEIINRPIHADKLTWHASSDKTLNYH